MQEAPKSRSFIEEFIEQDLTEGKVKGAIQTRFPPEPNGYLHIGHVKALYIDFSMAERFGGSCNLRFDDTNPTKEDTEYVQAIQDDIRWLGFKWDKMVYGSDYFEKTYEIAEDFIQKGLAYVDELSQAEMREYRGTLTKPGKNSPFRDRPAEESLDLFRRMRAGEFENGRMVLRGKIDMSSPNVLLRDPTLYRILHAHHHNTGDKWCIYPMYDFAHPIQDMIEGITHSLCSLEYEIHRPLYDWVRDNCTLLDAHPRQIEFARLKLTHTVLSKRYLRALVEKGYVSGWDDPRMPTLTALRRRGYSAASIHDFLRRVGIAKADSVVDIRLLEHCVREDLNASARRAMAVLDPLKITLSNWPEEKTILVSAENHPDHPEWGTRELPFGRTLYIEREDFDENPPPKFFRLAPGREVRLKSAYIIRCDEVVKGENGEIAELICSVDLSSLSGGEGASRKVKGTLHWVEAKSALPFEGRLYDYMFGDEEAAAEPEEGAEEGDEGENAAPAKPDFLARFNHGSIKVVKGFLEPALGELSPGQSFQFMRQGYFCVDPSSRPGAPVFNRTVSLKDSYRP